MGNSCQLIKLDIVKLMTKLKINHHKDRILNRLRTAQHIGANGFCLDARVPAWNHSLPSKDRKGLRACGDTDQTADSVIFTVLATHHSLPN